MYSLCSSVNDAGGTGALHDVGHLPWSFLRDLASSPLAPCCASVQRQACYAPSAVHTCIAWVYHICLDRSVNACMYSNSSARWCAADKSVEVMSCCVNIPKSVQILPRLLPQFCSLPVLAWCMHVKLVKKKLLDYRCVLLNKELTRCI